MMMRYAFIPYKMRVVAADKKIVVLVPAGFAAAIRCSWWCFAGAY